mgnify:FL=1
MNLFSLKMLAAGGKHARSGEIVRPLETVKENDMLPTSYCFRSNIKRWFTSDYPFGHRTNGPAIIGPDLILWTKEGCYHRGNDKPAIIYPNQISFFQDGQNHRDRNIGPAIITLYSAKVEFCYVHFNEFLERATSSMTADEFHLLRQQYLNDLDP